MKFHTSIPKGLKPYYKSELDKYQTEYSNGDLKSGKEIIGQIPRLIFGGVKSFVGKIPVGNPGGANVPPLKPFPIEKELQNIFEKAGIELI